ncbi:Gp37 family protein [Pseudomonas anguilliseptica]|uniref:Gp37 protein n=1 Tax=Pseudomonas anguilliseptica TaxID=53406 RepID=A0A1H5DAE1_PSEAG|nr:Gp37 family protein [Pseudomonas anguilliseptica]SED75786.1 Gp37 protein [Pseudomonas anguilliseptica]
MSQTLVILDALVARLQEYFGKQLSVELFPESPKNYRLNHPVGAVLVAFGSSKFGGSDAVDSVFLERNLVLPLTLVFKQLNGAKGVIGYLDQVRDCLSGWRPPHCDLSMVPVDEVFIGQVNGVWQYTQRFATRATQIQSPTITTFRDSQLGGQLQPPSFEATP